MAKITVDARGLSCPQPVVLTMDVQQYSARFVTEGYTKEQWQAEVQKWQTKYGRAFDILNGKG